MNKTILPGAILLISTLAGCSALVDETAFTKADLRDIGMKYHFFVDDFQRSPSNAEELLEYENALGNSARADDAIKSGKYTIVWDTDILGDKENLSKKLLAYEKEAAANGGIVCFQGLIVEEISQAEFAKAMQATNKNAEES